MPQRHTYPFQPSLFVQVCRIAERNISRVAKFRISSAGGVGVTTNANELALSRDFMAFQNQRHVNRGKQRTRC